MHKRTRVGALIAAACLTLGLLAAPTADAAPAAAPSSRYIVQVDPAVADVLGTVGQALAPLGGTVEAVYTHAIHGAVVSLPAPLALDLLRAPGILSVERDAVMRISETQSNPPWGLDRIDQRDRPLNQQYSFTTRGTGVDAYIIDTGILLTHSDFGGRAVHGFSAYSGGSTDCNGHGTHVAGTVGGSTYGVAKSARLIAVRVLDCAGSGTNASVIAGIDWAIQHHAAGQPAVANLSLGGGANSAIDTAIRNLVADGVSVAVAAGNERADACGVSPARVAEAITVAASDINDAMASFSNGGTCVDIFAPGVNVLSAWHTSTSATNTISGTSMSAPHVAGAAARHLQANPGATPAAVEAALTGNASLNKISGTARSCQLLFLLCRPATPANRLLYVAPAA